MSTLNHLVKLRQHLQRYVNLFLSLFLLLMLDLRLRRVRLLSLDDIGANNIFRGLYQR